MNLQHTDLSHPGAGDKPNLNDTPAPVPSPLLDQLEAARKALSDLDSRFENYDGNNPDKYVVPRQRAREHLAAVERACKAAGVLPLTEHEAREQRLDQAFPKVANRQVVEFEGSHFQRRFMKATVSRAGNPTSWTPYWAELKETDREVRRLKEPQEHKDWRSALERLWPFDRPVGGIEFEVAVGDPAVHIERSRKAHTYSKGRPVMGVHITVHVTTTLEGWAMLLASQATREDASDVLYPRGLIIAGDTASGWRLRKSGRAADAVKLEPFGGDKAQLKATGTA